MALINITSKQVDSDAYNERKVLATDINQIKGALQIGTYDIAPNNIDMEGTEITANGGSNFIRYNSGTNKTEFNDAGVWKTPEALQTISVTAGEDLAIRDMVYIDSADGLAYKCDLDDTTKQDWIGSMSEVVTTGNSGAAYSNGDINGGFTGLTTGEWYGLSSTPGEVSLGSTSEVVGIAISATQIKLIKMINNRELGEIIMHNPTVTGAKTLVNMRGLGFAVCDGTTPASQGISSPIIATTPDMTDRFVYGHATTAETTGGTALITTSTSSDSGSGGDTKVVSVSTENRPPFVTMVFMMKVR